MALKGSRELNARLKAIKQTFKPLGKDWADRTADHASRAVGVRSGRLKRSFRRKSATQKRATVVGHFTANFEDAGAKEHPLQAKRGSTMKFTAGGRTFFRKRVRHPGRRARPFKKEVAQRALNEVPMAQHMIDLWNRAA